MTESSNFSAMDLAPIPTRSIRELGDLPGSSADNRLSLNAGVRVAAMTQGPVLRVGFIVRPGRNST